MKLRNTIKNLSHERIAELKDQFSILDPGDEGSVSIRDVRLLIEAIIPNESEEVYKEILESSNLHRTASCSFPQFVTLLCAINTLTFDKQETEKITEKIKLSADAFAYLDKNNDGEIDLASFVVLLMNKGVPLSSNEVSHLITHLQMIGCIHNKKVNYVKFVQNLKQLEPLTSLIESAKRQESVLFATNTQ